MQRDLILKLHAIMALVLALHGYTGNTAAARVRYVSWPGIKIRHQDIVG